MPFEFPGQRRTFVSDIASGDRPVNRAGAPGIRGYDFDEPVDDPQVRADYDLYGMSAEADMLQLDRISESVNLGRTALFPHAEYVVRAARADDPDFTDEYDELMAERNALNGKKDEDANA